MRVILINSLFTDKYSPSPKPTLQKFPAIALQSFLAHACVYNYD